jgi:hypothetical protein
MKIIEMGKKEIGEGETMWLERGNTSNLSIVKLWEKKNLNHKTI